MNIVEGIVVVAAEGIVDIVVADVEGIVVVAAAEGIVVVEGIVVEVDIADAAAVDNPFPVVGQLRPLGLVQLECSAMLKMIQQEQQSPSHRRVVQMNCTLMFLFNLNYCQ